MLDAVAMLMDSPLNQVLSGPDAEELVRLGSTRALDPGQHLFRAGDPGDALFIVLQGGLDVVIGEGTPGEAVVASVGPGQILGELELMAQCPRMAGLVASEGALLLELPADRIEQLLRLNRPAANKLVGTVARTLALRLTAVNERLVSRQPPGTEDTGATHHQEASPVVDDDDLKILDRLWG